jgi:hypothetical protein
MVEDIAGPAMFGFQTDAAVAAFGAAGTSVWRKAVLQCGEKRHFGAAGTSVAAVDDRHFDAAERREAGCCGTSVLLVLRRCCGRSAGLAFGSTSVPLLERPPCWPSTAASGPAID